MYRIYNNYGEESMSRYDDISFEHRDRYIQIGLNIAYYRKREGLTQEALAEKAKISRSYISAIESPAVVKPISLDVLFRIADVLGVKETKLLELRD